jgi:hypothetical protein
MYILGLMKNGPGIQAILRPYIKNLRGLNVGINDGEKLWALVE